MTNVRFAIFGQQNAIFLGQIWVKVQHEMNYCQYNDIYLLTSFSFLYFLRQVHLIGGCLFIFYKFRQKKYPAHVKLLTLSSAINFASRNSKM